MFPRALIATALAAAALPLASPPATAATRLPNTAAADVTLSRATVAEGGTLVVRHRVLNSGTTTAAATTTRFYLSANPTASRAARAASTSNPRTAPTDLLLVGARAVPQVAAGHRTGLLSTTVGVPLGTAPGRYRVLACSDDRGVVRERSETDNCAPSATSLTVTALPGTATMQLPQYADTEPWMPAQYSVMYLKMMCQRTVPAQRLTPATAISNLKRMLTTAGGADILTRVARSGRADDAAEAESFAAEGMLRSSPGLALAALLRAHDLEPGIGTHLVNAAAVAIGLNRPNEALGLLDAAAPLDYRRGAMGINPQYVAQVVRGEALVMTGRPTQAAPLFSAVRAAEPRLTEADAGLAAVEACAGHDALAARYVRASRQRTQQKKSPTEDPTTPEPTRPAPDLDRTHRIATEMRTLTIPETPSAAIDLLPTYSSIDGGFQGEVQALVTKRDELQQRLDGTAELLTQAELDRRDALMAQADLELDTPDLHQLETTLDTKIRLMTELRDGFFGGPGHEQDATLMQYSNEAALACQGAPDSEGCYHSQLNNRCQPELARLHTQWRGLLGEAQTVAAQYVAEASRRVSAIASNLSDDAAGEMVLLDVTGLERIEYSRLVESAMTWMNQEAVWKDDCVQQLDYTPPPPVQGVPQPGWDGACPELLRTVTFTLDLGVSQLAVSCDQITQSFATDTPILSAFADLTWDIRSGQFTVFAGAKGQVKLGGVVDINLKSGGYLTSDGKGGLKDAGWRVAYARDFTHGIASYSAAKDQIDFSFLAPFRTGP
ncbi:MAG TPA: hypothetical protein VJ872_06500 [Nocardioides sp.]|nr:hypothetical protein [Nocardioides sp.]